MESEEVVCVVCSKSFGNSKALNNHVRVEHVEVYDSEDPAKWTQIITKKPAKPKAKNAGRAETSKLENKIISQISPDSLAQLANGEVGYVMIMSHEVDKLLDEKNKKKKRKEPETILGDTNAYGQEKKLRKPYVKKIKEPNLPMTFKCPEDGCDKEFPVCCTFSIHFRDDHRRKKKSNKCQVCEKLLLPKFVVDDGAPYKCQSCREGFKTPKELRGHMDTRHPKIKPYKCGACKKRFTQKNNLLQHMRLHTGEKPFTCDFCKRNFRQKSTLTHHLRVHTKQKPYQCVICQNRFSQYGILRQHMRTHTNIAPFKCHLCQHTFKQIHHLRNHLKNFHDYKGEEKDVNEDGVVLHDGAGISVDNVKMEGFESLDDPEILELEVCNDDTLLVE